jgi:hypothetical protein
VEITNTPEDRKDPIKKNQLFIAIHNLSDKICKISSISVKTMPLNPSDKSLTLNHDRDLLVKELNENGYNIDHSYDIPPGSKISTVFESSRIVHDENGIGHERDNLDNCFTMLYKIDVSFRYFKIPITMQFILEKYRLSSQHIDDYRLISSKEKILPSFAPWLKRGP